MGPSRTPRRRPKRSVQQPLPLPSSHGGARTGAGRKPRGPRAGVPHRTRAVIDRHHPLHVTIRAVPAVGRLRRRDAYRAIKNALVTTLGRGDFRICHLSIQANHLHLIVEASHRRALSRGMQGFQISAARRLNAALSRPGAPRRGRVFADRYHARPQTSPREVRNCLAYVLGNWRRHDEHRRAPRHWRLDPYSSAIALSGWRDLPGPIPFLPHYELLPVSVPRTWLLAHGWRRAGLLTTTHRPGPQDRPEALPLKL